MVVQSSSPAPISAPRPTSAWRTLGVFLLAWGVAWLAKARLLTWLTAPLAALPAESRPRLVFSQPSDAFVAYFWLATVAAFVAVLPLVTRSLWFRQRTLPPKFLAVSYGALALFALIVHVFVLPDVWGWAAHAGSKDPRRVVPLSELGHLARLFALGAAITQLAVIPLFSKRSGGTRP